MIEISQKRVTNIKSHLPDFLLNKNVIIGIRVDGVDEEKIKRAGFTLPLDVGQSVLPSIIGPITRFNSEGKDRILRDQPKEVCYRNMEFTRSEWHGQDRVEVTSCVWISYYRYPREHINGPEVELTVGSSPDGTLMIVTEQCSTDEGQLGAIQHKVNLLLEIFGSAVILEVDENPVHIPNVRKLHWNVLPPGVYPWDKVEESVRSGMQKQSPKSLAAALDRFAKITSLGPDFTGIGNAGYKGYVVFGFSALNLFVLESQQSGNAIYIFGDDWETLSQYSKAQILFGNLHVQRIIHTESWFADLRRALTPAD